MHHHPDSELMRKAIDLSAEAGIRQRTGGVFGAVIVNKETGEIVGQGFNRELGVVDVPARWRVCARG